MSIQSTLDKMSQLKLIGMANELERQMSNPTSNEIPFEERIRILVDHELTFRGNKRIQIFLKKAKLQMNASIDNIDYRTQRGIDKAYLLSLTSLDWVQQHQNLIITGPTGTGKTWLACAMGHQACLLGMSTYFTRMAMLKEEFLAAHATGTFKKLLNYLAKFELLILDDWGMQSLNPRLQEDMFELIDARVGTKSTIFNSQIPIDAWHNTLDNKNIADAILDRLIHSSHALKLEGESLRRKAKKLSN